MTTPHINQTASRGQPTQAAIGELKDGTTVDEVTSALADIGIEPDRIYFLIGTDGAEALNKSQGLFRVFDDVIGKPLKALRAGKTLVGVFGVDKDDAPTVRHTLVEAGVGNTHYFGKWTYS